MIAVALASLGLFWLPFVVKTEVFYGIDFGGHGLETIVANFDGLNYLAVAKTMYDPQLLARDFAGLDNPPIYYAAHFPLYPLLIALLDIWLSGPHALLGSIVLSNIALACGLYFFATTFVQDKRLALALACALLFFPARMLSARSVGSSEPLFIALTLASLAWASSRSSWRAGVAGMLAILTRSSGIWLLGAYVLTYWRTLKRLVPYLLIPVGAVALFGVYQVQLGDFWAYFHNSYALHPVGLPPLLIFGNMQKWVSGMWREEFVYLYAFYGIGVALIAPRLRLLRNWGMVYGIFLLLIAHQDLGRYALPLAPLALLGYSRLVQVKYLFWGALLLLPIYLLGWQFVVGNVQAVSDWGAFL